MSAVSEFKADPCDFLEKNIVLQMVAGTGVVGSTDDFTLVETTKSGTLFNGTACPVYEMQLGSSGDLIRAYWCPYEDEKVRSTTLAGDADYMFTAKMTGCSFGVGIPAIDGSVRVAHANIQESDALNQIGDAMYQAFDPKKPDQSAKIMGFLECKKTVVKTQEQAAALLSENGVNGQLSTEINPANYRGLISTTFGLRSSTGRWKFYFHAFQQTGPKFKLFGCFPFPNQG